MRRVVFNRRGSVRAPWRVLLYGAGFLLFSTGSAFLLAVTGFAGPGLTAASTPAYLALCLSALLPGLLLLVTVDGHWRNPGAASGWRAHDRFGTELVQGAVLGFLIVLAVWLVDVTLGMVEVSAGGVGPRGLVTVFVVLLLAAAFEELLFRGYLLAVLIDGAGKVAGIVITSVLFAVAHNSNPGADLLSFVNTFLAGALLALAYVETRSLWLPTALHVSWNYCLGVVFGLPVSGIALPQRILASDLTERGRAASILTGGDYGAEGGLLLTLAVILACLWLWRSRWVVASPEMDPVWRWREEPDEVPLPEVPVPEVASSGLDGGEAPGED